MATFRLVVPTPLQEPGAGGGRIHAQFKVPPGCYLVRAIAACKNVITDWAWFDVTDNIPGRESGSGVVQMVFELIAEKGGGVHRETIEVFLFLPPKTYLPVVLRDY